MLGYVEKPECRLCGSRHWFGEGHVFVEPEALAVAETETDTETGTYTPLSQVERNRRWRERNREAYNAYQRGYMRKRRGY